MAFIPQPLGYEQGRIQINKEIKNKETNNAKRLESYSLGCSYQQSLWKKKQGKPLVLSLYD